MNTEYDFVQLLVALTNRSTQQSIEYGKMTVFIRYRAPFLVNNHDPLLICNDVLLYCLLGLPNLLALCRRIDIVKLIRTLLLLRIYQSRALHRASNLIMYPLFLYKGYPLTFKLRLPQFIRLVKVVNLSVSNLIILIILLW